MAKGSSSSKKTSLDGLLSPNTIQSLPIPLTVEQTTYYKVKPNAQPIGDRRKYHPQNRMRPAHAFNRNAIRLVDEWRTARVAFNVPRLVGICVRRKVRREVLHALNRTGKGSGGPRRRNFYSSVKC